MIFCALVGGEGYTARAKQYAAATREIVAALNSMPGIKVRPDVMYCYSSHIRLIALIAMPFPVCRCFPPAAACRAGRRHHFLHERRVLHLRFGRHCVQERVRPGYIVLRLPVMPASYYWILSSITTNHVDVEVVDFKTSCCVVSID